MAKKRLKKKIVKREKEELLKKSNLFSNKEIKKLINKSESEIKKEIEKRKKEEKKRKRNERAKRVYQSLVSEGIEPKTARKLRYASQKRIDDILSKQRKEFQRKIEEQRKKEEQKKNKKRLLIFWRDKVDFTTDPDGFEDVVKAHKHMPIEFLILTGRGYLQGNGGEIGDYKILVAKDEENSRQLKNFYAGAERGFYSEWVTAYEGKAVRYRELLIKIIAVLTGLYYATEKMWFMMDLIRAVYQVNPDMAKRLQRDFQIQYI